MIESQATDYSDAIASYPLHVVNCDLCVQNITVNQVFIIATKFSWVQMHKPLSSTNLIDPFKADRCHWGCMCSTSSIADFSWVGSDTCFEMLCISLVAVSVWPLRDRRGTLFPEFRIRFEVSSAVLARLARDAPIYSSDLGPRWL